MAIPLLQDQKAKSAMISGYRRLKEKLGEPGVTERAAKTIFDSI